MLLIQCGEVVGDVGCPDDQLEDGGQDDGQDQVVGKEIPKYR